jgi:hypothetical protein
VRANTLGAFARADLFSRETRPGFEGWGFEHGKFDEETATIARAAADLEVA